MMRLVVLASTVVMSTGCATPGSTVLGSEEGVTIQPFEEFSGGTPSPASACKVGFTVRYPEETPPHERVIRYRYGYELSKGNPVGALKEGGGPIALPRPERDWRAVPQGDGTVAFKVAVMTFSPCESSVGAGTLELIIGSCASGECPPMRYRAPEPAAIAKLRLAEE